MEIILKEDVPQLGKRQEVVTVADGYARNFLIPKGMAILATEGNKKSYAEHLRLKQARKDKQNDVARETARKMESVSLTIPVKVGENDKMYGSITTQNIVDALKQENIEVDKKSIELKDIIKELGVYTIPVRLSKEVAAKIKVWVVKEAE